MYLQKLLKLVWNSIEAIKIIQDVLTKCSQFSGTTRTAINKKLPTVFNKNKGFQIVYNISKILTNEKENVGDLDIPENLTSSDIAYFKFASIISEDVKRSFFFLYKIFWYETGDSFNLKILKNYWL